MEVLLDIPMKIGPEKEEEEEEDFLEDEEVDNMTFGGDCCVVNFQLQEVCEEDEGEEYQFLGFLSQHLGVCLGFSLLQNVQENHQQLILICPMQ